MRRTIGYVAAGWLALHTLMAPGGVAVAGPPDTEPTSADRQDAESVERARELQGAGRWEEAAAAWKTVAREDPNNGTAWFNMGYCLHAAGRLDEAIEIHRRAAEFDDYHGIALYNLGCAYALIDEPDAALEALAASQEAGFGVRGYAETDSDLDSLRGDPRFRTLLDREPAGWRGRLQQVLAGARHWAREHGPQAKKHLAGIMQQVAQRAQGMLAGLQKRLAGDERFADLAARLESLVGGARGSHEQQDAAAAGADATATGVTLADAQRYQQAGDWKAAVAAYGELVESTPDSPAVWFGLAYCLHMSGDYEKAIKAHRSAATFEQIEGISLYNLACAYALTGRTDEAFEALESSREAGFDIARPMQSDSDLDSLRNDPRFEVLADAS